MDVDDSVPGNEPTPVESGVTPSPSPPSPPPSTTPGGPPSPGLDPALGPAIDRVAGELAGELGVAREDVEAVVAEFVVWPDGSLGCPEPGMSYTQALVDGARIVLEVDGRRYHYHGGGNTDLFRCDAPQAPPPGRPPGDGT